MTEEENTTNEAANAASGVSQEANPQATPDIEPEAEEEATGGPSAVERARDLVDKGKQLKETAQKTKQTAEEGKKAAEVAKAAKTAKNVKNAANLAADVGETAATEGVAAVKLAADLLMALWDNRRAFLWPALFIIAIIVGLVILFMAGALGMNALDGAGGMSGPVLVGAKDPDVKAVLDLAATPATVDGQTVAGYTKIKLADRDKEFLRNVYDNGMDKNKNGRVDKRLIKALIYLAGKHDYINVSNIVFQYEDMPVNIENSANPQILKNISAHVYGQAADLREVDFIYKGVSPLPTCGLNDPRRDIVWLMKEGSGYKELLRQKCLGNIVQQFSGGPIILGMTTQALPIKIVWQDDPPTKNSSAKGTVRSVGEAQLERAMALPEGSLDSTKPGNILQRIGLGELTQQMGLGPDQLVGKTTPDIYQTLGRTEIEDLFRLPAGSLRGQNLDEILQSAAQASLEQLWQLPAGSWQGNNLNQLSQSVGRALLEYELGLPPQTLLNAATAKALLQERNISSADILKVVQELSLPPDPVVKYLDGIQKGTVNPELLITLGARELERVWQLPTSVLDGYLQGGAVGNELAKLSSLNWETLEQSLAVPMPVGFSSALVNSLGKGEDIAAAVSQTGTAILNQAFDLTGGQLEAIRLGQQTWSPVVIDEGLEDEATIRNRALNIILGKGNVNDVWQSYGQSVLTDYLKDGQALEQIIDLADGERQALLDDLLGGAQGLGQRVLEENLSLATKDIQQLLQGQGLALNNQILAGLDKGLGLANGTVADLLSGKGVVGEIASLGAAMGGGGLLSLGSDQATIMSQAYRPAARNRVHRVVEELVDISEATKDYNLKVTQLITFNEERDVLPFAEKLDKVYGLDRAPYVGLFAMPEAHPNIHIGY